MLYSGDKANYVTVPQSRLDNFSILQVVNKMHYLYANAVVQPSVQHYLCYKAWKIRFIRDVDTDTFV